jgi:hypothetical protein
LPLLLLAADNVPEEARKQVVERLDRGEITEKEAKEIADKVRAGQGLVQRAPIWGHSQQLNERVGRLVD